jgi:hypothetical protein
MKGMRSKLVIAALALPVLLAASACRDHTAAAERTAAAATSPAAASPLASASARAPPSAYAVDPLPDGRGTDTAAPAASASAALPPDPPARVERLPIDHDVPAALVRGTHGALPHILFLPGVCSNIEGYLDAFPEAARAHGGVLGIDGDQACAPNFRSFSWDPAKQDARFRAALLAAGLTDADVDAGGFTLVGYSSGADIGQLMAQRWPERYTKLVLIGAPSDPMVARIARADAVVTMSCSRDVPGRMKDAARRIELAGIPSEYVEMPGCPHGYITDGEHVFGDTFDFLATHSATHSR